MSRQGQLDTADSTVICAPIYSSYHGLRTQLVGKVLTDHKGRLTTEKIQELDDALAAALGLR